MSVEKLIDKMIQEAISRGEFDNPKGKENHLISIRTLRRPKTCEWAIPY